MENNTPFYKNVISTIKYKRDRLLDGKLNCIPFELEGFEEELPGIEPSQYVIITANQKVGKTKLTDFLYLYKPFLFSLNHPEIPIQIKYFSLELSKEKKMMQVMCFMLFLLSGRKIRVSLKGLNGIFKDRIVDEEVIQYLDSPIFTKYMDHFDSIVEIIDNIRNPFGIFNYMKQEVIKTGYFEEKIIPWEDPVTKKITDKVTKGRFVKNDPESYFIGIIDHYSLLQPEKDQTSTRDAVIKFSSVYALELRDKFYCSIAAVQQQAAAQESVENKKWDKTLPSADGLGEVKITSRDVDALIGLHSPYRHAQSAFSGYNINEWKDNIRFLVVINNREGAGSTMCPLLFDGATDTFMVLPENDSPKMVRYKKLLTRIRNSKYVVDYEDDDINLNDYLENPLGITFFSKNIKKLNKTNKLIKKLNYYAKNISSSKNWFR